MWYLLLKIDVGIIELVTTDLLSMNMTRLGLIGTTKYIRFALWSMIWSTAVLAATNSHPYVTDSTLACFLEYQSIGVPFTRCNMAVTAIPVARP